jgi:hypothetical protein
MSWGGEQWGRPALGRTSGLALREALKPATVLFEGDDPRFFKT